jgi:hypothetical protein
VRVPSGERAETIRAQRVEAHRQAPEPGRAQLAGLLGEEHAVGGERQIVEAGLARQDAHEDSQISARQRLAAGEADLVDSDLDESVDERADLLVGEQVAAREPDVLRLGHAVVAAEVAAIRNGDAYAPERAAEQIEGRHA